MILVNIWSMSHRILETICEVPNAVPGCQSGLFSSGQPSSSGSGDSVQASNSMQEQQKEGQTIASHQMPSDPKAAQTVSTSTSNVQQSIVQESSLPIQQIHPLPMMTPMIGNSLHNPYGMRSFNQPMLVPAQPVYTNQHQYMRAADNMGPMGFSDGSVSNTRLVPSQLHYFDPSEYSSRQTLPVQRGPAMELTYNPEDMVKVYGAGNFQPPVFTLWKSPRAFRGLQGFQQFSNPPIDYRFINGGQQLYQQRPVEHPLQKLRQAGPLDHANQPLPPNVYRAGKWEPVTNLQVENPVNLAEFENAGYGIQGPAGYSMQGARESSSTPLCREKRQMDPSWMYQLADWSNYGSRLGQQRAAASLPGLTPPSPLTPYHGPFAPLSEIFPSAQPLGTGQMYSPGFTNPQAKGAVEGIQHFVTGIANMVPMFSGASPLYR
uniref:Folliculin n=2 Tax=Lygus hesperus TaxID=30085 RepID=A0A0A9X972_LYGHE